MALNAQDYVRLPFNENYPRRGTLISLGLLRSRSGAYAGLNFECPESSMTALSAVGGAILLAFGSNFIVPIGSAVGGICDLAGIASLMVFLGLLDGE
jgi:hypothetical protein